MQQTLQIRKKGLFILLQKSLKKNESHNFLNRAKKIPHSKCYKEHPAACRIRTNDPEITSHVLWPAELRRQ